MSFSHSLRCCSAKRQITNSITSKLRIEQTRIKNRILCNCQCKKYSVKTQRAFKNLFSEVFYAPGSAAKDDWELILFCLKFWSSLPFGCLKILSSQFNLHTKLQLIWESNDSSGKQIFRQIRGSWKTSCALDNI